MTLLLFASSISLTEAAPAQPTLKPGFKTTQNNQWIWVELVYKTATGPDGLLGTPDDWCPDGYNISGTVYGAAPLCDYGAPQWGYMKYVVKYKSFNGMVKATGLKPNTLYQVTLNGQAMNGARDQANETTSWLLSRWVQTRPGWNVSYGGWWHPGWAGDGSFCIGAGAGGCVHWDDPATSEGFHDGDEGYYNFALAILSDSTGAFSFSFNSGLTVGSYVQVKFLMKEVSNGGFGGPFTPVLMEYTQLNFQITTR